MKTPCLSFSTCFCRISGSVTLSLLVLFSSCSKSKDDPALDYFFKGNINGRGVSIEAGPDTDDPRTFRFDSETVWPGGDPEHEAWIESAQGCSIRSSEQQLSINVYLVGHLPVNYTDEQKNAMFQLGPHPFGFHYQNFGKSQPGVVITLMDNGKSWHSELGPHPAGNDQFEIVSMLEWKESNAQKLWNVRFSCNLYDEEGHTLRVNDATFQAHVLTQ